MMIKNVSTTLTYISINSFMYKKSHFWPLYSYIFNTEMKLLIQCIQLCTKLVLKFHIKDILYLKTQSHMAVKRLHPHHMLHIRANEIVRKKSVLLIQTSFIRFETIESTDAMVRNHVLPVTFPLSKYIYKALSPFRNYC
jgi:hypothetical protein